MIIGQRKILTPATIGGSTRRVVNRLGVPQQRIGRDLVDFTGGSNTTAADDTVNFFRSTTQKSKKATGLGTTTTLWLTSAALSSLDLENHLFRMPLFIYDGSSTADPSQFQEVSVRFQSGSSPGGSWTNNFASAIGQLQRWADPGSDGNWIEFWGSINLGTEGGTFVGTDVTAMRLIVTMSASSATCSLSMGDVEFFAQRTNDPYPQLAITWDDGRDTQYQELAYLAALGIYCTVYIIPSHVGNVNYMTLAQLHAVKRMGHLVALHGYNHLSWVAGSATESGIINDIERGIEWMCANGFADGAHHWAQPGGTSQWRTLDDQDLLLRYFDSVRISNGRFYLSDCAGGPIHTIAVTADDLGESTSVVESGGHLEDSAGVMLLVFHEGEVGGMSTLWDAIAARVAANGYRTARIDDLV